MKIRNSTPNDLTEIETIHKAAFEKTEGAQKAQGIANLVHDLFEDESAKPLYSLVATENENRQIQNYRSSMT